MSTFAFLLVTFLAAVNPPAIALAAAGFDGETRRGRALAAGGGVAVALALYLAAALGAETWLEALDVAPETFRLAAGLVMVVAGGYAVWRGRVAAGAGEGGWLAGISPLGVPLLASPAGLVAAISHGADDGEGKTLAAALVVIALAGVLAFLAPRRGGAALDAAARLLGALLIVLAAGLAVDGVRAV